MADKQFVIKGTVVDKATGDGVEDLYVEAWDEHGAYDKTLGSDTTNEKGEFTIRFAENWFKQVFRERRPDVYFMVYREDELLTSGDYEGVDLAPLTRTRFEDPARWVKEELHI